jgi:hypothetical protein
MAAQAQTPPRSHRETDAVYAAWWAGFIEDAEDVHLALKPSYAAVIAGLLGDEQVRAIYVRATINGAQRLAALERRLGARLGTEMFETQTSWRPPSLDWCADHPGADERREQRATVAGQVVALSVRRGGGPGVRVPAISNRVLSAREKRRKERRQARLGYQHLSCTCTQ